MRNIALYGGAFDPPHIGHMQLIHQLTKVPGIDQVWLLPCGDRKDKQLLLSTPQRLNLIKTLFQNAKNIRISQQQIQISRNEGNQVHTLNLMNYMNNKYKQSRFHFVVGGDVLHTIHNWYRGEELRQEHPFIVFYRKGYEMVKEKMPPCCQLIETELPEISSSFIKKAIVDKDMGVEEKKGVLRPWVHGKVLDFLEEEKVI